MRSNHRDRSGRASTVVILLTAFVVAGIAIGITWYVTDKAPRLAREEERRQLVLGAMGLTTPVTNKLDARFTDADGDLVADPPKDEKAWLDPPTLTFCYVAVHEPETAQEFKDAWSDFTKYLGEATGKPVEYLVLDSEQEQLKALRDGRLHVTGLNTGRVPVAVNACGFVPVAMLADAAGNGKTHTEIIIPKGSPAKTIADLKGRELVLTDPGSNSGYKAPLVFLKDHNLLPERDFLIRYSGSHDASILGIADGQYQAAAVAADVLKRAVGSGAVSPDQYRVLFKSENFPTAGLGYVYNLKPDLAKKVSDALLKFEWAGTATEGYFARSGQSKLVPVNYKEDWALVRRIDDAIGYKHVLDEHGSTTNPSDGALPATGPTARARVEQ